MSYKKNDLVRFSTNQPILHLLRMFGGPFNPDEVEARTYIGIIKDVTIIKDDVFSNGNVEFYTATTIADLYGFHCHLSAAQIIGPADISELTDEQKANYDGLKQEVV